MAYTRTANTIPDDTPGGSSTRQAVADQNSQAIDDLFTNLNIHSNNEDGRSHIDIDSAITQNINDIAALNAGSVVPTESWIATKTYSAGDLVYGSDFLNYRAIQTTTGNDPTSSPTYWTLVASNLQGLDEGTATFSTPNLTLDFSTGVVFSHTATAALTVVMSNEPAGNKAAAILLRLTDGGAYVVTWPTGIKWPSGSAPALTSGGLDYVYLMRDSSGAWSGVVQNDVKVVA